MGSIFTCFSNVNVINELVTVEQKATDLELRLKTLGRESSEYRDNLAIYKYLQVYLQVLEINKTQKSFPRSMMENKAWDQYVRTNGYDYGSFTGNAQDFLNDQEQMFFKKLDDNDNMLDQDFASLDYEENNIVAEKVLHRERKVLMKKVHAFLKEK